MLIGATNVGKTALVYRYVLDELPLSITSTNGVEFTKRTVTDSATKGKIQLHIWDTAGQERYKSVAKHYYRGAAACILVYDMTSLDSFEEVPNWLAEVQENTPTTCTLCLVANKADLDSRVVTREQGQAYAKRHKLTYLETSAYWPRTTPVTDHLMGGVDLVFETILRKSLVQTPDRPAPQIKLNVKDLYVTNPNNHCPC